MVDGEGLQGTYGKATRAYPRLLGGRLSLDFVNTLDPRASDQPRDFLNAYADLVGWSHYAGILTTSQADELVASSAAQPVFAAVVFVQAIAFREALHRAFLAISRGRTPARVDLDAIQEAYWTALAHARLSPRDRGLEWVWLEDGAALDRPLWEIARSAVELLTAPEIGRVKECANHGCGWLFLDSSKNGSRRWCSMEGCGSQIKMRRQYARKRAALSPTSSAD
jgi:predicted RNA-binding Zn ribbon-like protein